MRHLPTLLLLAAVALSVVNALQVRALRAEVNALRAAAEARAVGETSDIEARVREILQQASEHSARAQRLLREGDAEGARQELRESAEKVQAAAELAGDSGILAEIRERAGKTAQSIEEMIGRLKKKPAPEP